jgi:hypothetical protein
MWRFDGRRHNVYLTWDGLWRSYVAEGDEAREVAVVGFNIWSPDGVRLAYTSTARCSRQGERRRGGNGGCSAFPIRRVAPGAGMDFGVSALIALNSFLSF